MTTKIENLSECLLRELEDVHEPIRLDDLIERVSNTGQAPTGSPDTVVRMFERALSRLTCRREIWALENRSLRQTKPRI